jgi:hypothetical protein
MPIAMGYGDKVKTIKADTTIEEISAAVHEVIKPWTQ